MKRLFFLGLLSSLLTFPLTASPPSSIAQWETDMEQDKDSLWKAKLRSRALLKLDKMLNWAVPIKERMYALQQTQVGFHFVNDSTDLTDFERSFGYFSHKHPIVARVTPFKEDVVLSSQLLKHTFEQCQNEDFLEIATGEILCKILAYRALEKDMIISIPVVFADGVKELVEYRIDTVFKLWLGMPAFGLVPLKGQAPAILLFRGTDLSLESKQGWASVLSDLDIQGPGLTAFQKSKADLEKWLKRQASSGIKAKVMGFSLGGVLAMYTMLYEHDLLNETGSMAFNPPGVSTTVYKEWRQIPQANVSAFKIYITQGDVIPKIGKLVGEPYELSLDISLRPIAAHVRFMCSYPSLYQFAIDKYEENRIRH